MLIRSQDRNYLIEMTDIKLSIRNDSYIIDYFGEPQIVDKYIIVANKKEILGKYSSQKQAQEVLDLIQYAYTKANCEMYNFGFIKNVVFEMPKDEEE